MVFPHESIPKYKCHKNPLLALTRQGTRRARSRNKFSDKRKSCAMIGRWRRRQNPISFFYKLFKRKITILDRKQKQALLVKSGGTRFEENCNFCTSHQPMESPANCSCTLLKYFVEKNSHSYGNAATEYGYFCS